MVEEEYVEVEEVVEVAGEVLEVVGIEEGAMAVEEALRVDKSGGRENGGEGQGGGNWGLMRRWYRSRGLQRLRSRLWRRF